MPALEALSQPIGLSLLEQGLLGPLTPLYVTSFIFSIMIFGWFLQVFLPWVMQIPAPSSHSASSSSFNIPMTDTISTSESSDDWVAELQNPILSARTYHLSLILSSVAVGIGILILNPLQLPFFVVLLGTMIGVLACERHSLRIPYLLHLSGLLAMMALISDGFLQMAPEDLRMVVKGVMWALAYYSLASFYTFLRKRHCDFRDHALVLGWISIGLGDLALVAMGAAALLFLAILLTTRWRNLPGPLPALGAFPSLILLGGILTHFFVPH